MTIQTKHSVGEKITVKVDGTDYTGKINEVHCHFRIGDSDVVVTYSADVSRQFKNKDGTLRTDVRNWIGNDEEIL